MEHPMITAATKRWTLFQGGGDYRMVEQADGQYVEFNDAIAAALQWLEDPANLSDAVIEAGSYKSALAISPDAAALIFTAMISALRKEIEGPDMEPLGGEFAKVWDDNADKLYEP